MTDRVVLQRIDLALILRIFLPSAAGNDVVLIVRSREDALEVARWLWKIEQVPPSVQHGVEGMLVTYPPFKDAPSGHIALLTDAQEDALLDIHQQESTARAKKEEDENRSLVRLLASQLKSMIPLAQSLQAVTAPA